MVDKSNNNSGKKDIVSENIDYEKVILNLEKRIDELSIKIPNLVDLIDEIITNERRYFNINENNKEIIEKLKSLKKQLESLEINNEKIDSLIADERNVTSTLKLIDAIVERREYKIKKYICDIFENLEFKETFKKCLKSMELEDVIAKSMINNFKESLESYIGRRLLASVLSISVILGVIVFLIEYFSKT